MPGQETRGKMGAGRPEEAESASWGQLIGLVKPLFPVMLLAIVLGTAGYLCAIFLTILAGLGVMHILTGGVPQIFILLAVMAVAGDFCTMENSTVIIILHLSCWRSSGTRFLQR